MKLIIALLLLGCQTALAQPYYGDSSESVARTRRANREKACTHAGAAARGLVESEVYGDDGARALLALPSETAAQLAEFHASGGFTRTARPKELLGLIGRHKSGQDITLWLLENARQLESDDAVTVFLEDPMTYVLALKKLGTAVAERQARLESEKRAGEKGAQHPPEPEPVPLMSRPDTRPILGLVIAAGLILFGIWYRRRSAGGLAA